MEEHIGKAIWNRMNTYSDKVMMRTKRNEKWEEFTGKQCNILFKKVAHSLLLEDVKHQENVGIYAQNMPEWSFADIGALFIGAVPIPIYATNIASQTKYILKDANIKVLFVGEQAQYDETLKIINDPEVKLEKVIVLDSKVKLNHPKSIHFYDWIEQDHASVASTFKVREQALLTKDLATIIYTSGTTGEPKGVMLSHEILVKTCENHDTKFKLSDKDSSLAFLPLTHVFERIWTYYVFHNGMMNTYSTDPKKIADLVKEVKPTVMCSVPRLYEKIYHMIYTKLRSASPIKKGLFHWAVKMGTLEQEAMLANKTLSGLRAFQFKLADKLVLSKIREGLGGNLRFMPCGGAALSKEITGFFRAVGLPIIVGYGLTETTATVTSFSPNSYKLGTVGKPMPNVEVKIDPENEEILVKGPNVMLGYYNKPEATAKVFTDGWFRTGDAGFFDEEGILHITDRIKDLIKTSGGKYIAPQQVEAVLTDSNLIEQVVIIGEGKPYATALLVPNFEAIKGYANYKEIPFVGQEDLIENPIIIAYYEKKVKELQSCLSTFEQIKKFKLMPTEFTMESGDMTPTFKLKRKIIVKKHHKLIEELYV